MTELDFQTEADKLAEAGVELLDITNILIDHWRRSEKFEEGELAALYARFDRAETVVEWYLARTDRDKLADDRLLRR